MPRFTISFLELAYFLRTLPGVRRIPLLGKAGRTDDRNGLFDVIACVRRKGFDPGLPLDMNVLRSRGLYSIAVLYHEAGRARILRLTEGRGVHRDRGTYTTRVTIALGYLVVAIDWCHTVNFEKLNGADFPRRF